MPSYRSKASGGRNRAGTRASQTIIDNFEIDSSKRRAKIVGILAGVAASFVTFVIVSTFQDLGVAFFWSVLIGIVAGAVVAGLVLSWPYLRMAWHWAGELVLLVFVGSVYVMLHVSFGPWVALGVLLQLLIVPWLIRPVCRFLIRWGMCMVVRHRIRVACDAFIEGKGVHGSVMPLILWARPTASGERVWLWLRGDLTLEDIQGRLSELASVCWANGAEAEHAGDRKAFVVVDIHRRDVLADGVEMHVDDMLEGIDPDSYPNQYETARDADDVTATPEDMDEEVSELLGANRGGRKPRKNKKEESRHQPHDGLDEGDIPEWI